MIWHDRMGININTNIMLGYFSPYFIHHFPRIIGDYNPDWGIARYRGPNKKIILELVRETKGSQELQNLQFPHEKRKILCAEKFFDTLGIDYRVVMDQADWWKPAPDQLVFE